ncbi:hypothetical protein P170DRAFT_433607 [Aspergillus steynii IBT 23096]|uniref:PAP-associated domain-containing protein n=1 Tax=Aspergillus steynii IBT 23096 TaxID=1392250 RepID=A0A2I2GFS6_9EURO|nr:uncharacterized protein P170DRAFT_433607 [Aspergillus steynii IBT 23096]PLB51734.1 hypothetical protein P170DRAFT_433607 [Aspergillus steynii IBT 23096]
MSRSATTVPQCLLRCLADRATMRDSLFARHSLPSLRSTPFLPLSFRPSLRFPSLSSRREFHGSRLCSREPAIFHNSLRKTLEAHRSLNRAGLIRKVIDKNSSSEETLPPEQAALVPEEPPRPTVTPRPVSASKPARCAKSKSSRQSTAAPSWGLGGEPVRWAVSGKKDRPAQSPWMAYVGPGHTQLDGIAQLGAEVRALDRYLAPTVEEQSQVAQVVAEVTGLLAGILPRPPRLIGPWSTGLALSHSDLEFLLPVPDSARSIERDRKPSATRPQVLQYYVDLLRGVENTLRQCSLFRDQVRVAGKRNQVLTATHRPTGLKLQFRCGEGPPSSIEYIRDYHAEYPSVRPLYMTSRLILESRGLFGSHSRSVGPDALVMLLVSFLKVNHGRFWSSDSLGAQLLEFLQFYGVTVDLTTTGISVDPPGCFNADNVKDACKNYDPEHVPAFLRGQRALVNLKRTAAARRNVATASRLCIQDPANYMNDLGRTCTRTRDLQRAFEHAYNLISASLGACKTSTDDSSGDSLLAHGLQANFDDFNQVRARIASAVRGPTATSGI